MKLNHWPIVAALVSMILAGVLNRLKVRSFASTTAIKMTSTSTSPQFAVGYITIKPEHAAAFAGKLVESGLAACVNIMPVTSVYKWKGAIENDAESLLVVKTRLEHRERIVEFLKQNHPYEVPELVLLPIQAGHVPYMDWLRENTELPPEAPHK